MEKKIGFAGITVCLLALSILVMSVGFAIQSEKLQINGSTTLSQSAKWDVHFDNIKVSDGSVNSNLITTPATINDNSTIITYDVTLEGYGDYYEFTVDMVNGGNMDALISSVMFLQEEESKDFISYGVFYLDGSNVSINDELPKNSSKTIKVRVENINSKIVLEEALKYDVSFALEFIQK